LPGVDAACGTRKALAEALGFCWKRAEVAQWGGILPGAGRFAGRRWVARQARRARAIFGAWTC